MRQVPLHFELQAIPKPRQLDEQAVSKCRDLYDAHSIAFRFSDFSHEQIAEALGISKSHFSQMLSKNHNKYFDMNRLEELEALIGNQGISQFFDQQRRGLLKRQQHISMSVEEKAAAYDRLTA